MTRLHQLAVLCQGLEATSRRLHKVRLVADLLLALDAGEVAAAVAYLTGRAFPTSDARVLGVRGLPMAGPAASEPSITLADVAETFAAVAGASGSGSRAIREERLAGLAARATEDERALLWRIITGEMRTGVSDGLVLEAIALAAGVETAAARRAALFLGDLSTVATLALTGGADALAGVTPQLFVPLSPMLAEIATDFDSILAAHGGRTALEYKYDGARIQLHRAGDRVVVWTRGLADVTASLPDVVEVARRDLGGAPFVLDGEVVALDASYERRWEALAGITGGRYLAERAIVESAGAGRAFFDRALAAGHEGVMAKDLASAYEPGGRGKRWFKLKQAQTVDCVIVAVDRGSGRRVGWLSNYHLAVRDGDGFADVGKTFKGLTDQQFREMTKRLWALAVADDGYTVRVRPEVVVEVAYNEIQKSPTYPSGFALRFARITRLREDKPPGQATTLEELRAIYERQFRTKGRAHTPPEPA